MQNPMITWTVVGERMTQKKGIIPFLQTSHPLGFGFHLKGSPQLRPVWDLAWLIFPFPNGFLPCFQPWFYLPSLQKINVRRIMKTSRPHISRLHSTGSLDSSSTSTTVQPAKPGGPEQKQVDVNQ